MTASGHGLVSVDPDTRASVGIESFSTAFAIEALVRHCWEVRVLASTIALAYLATGRRAGAVYASFGAALHVAAGALLAQEAGAIVSDQLGANWTIDSPLLLVAATRDLHTELLTFANQIYAESARKSRCACACRPHPANSG